MSETATTRTTASEPGLSPKIEYAFLLTSRFMKRSGKVVHRLAYPTPQTNLTVARCRNGNQAL
jgi:hypothetical protein